MGSKKEIVVEWRKTHPEGRRCELYNSDLNLSKATVDRWWNLYDPGVKPKNASYIVALWRLNHPNGTKSQCIEETGLSRRSVFLRWDAPAPKKEEIPEPEVKADDLGQLFFDF